MSLYKLYVICLLYIFDFLLIYTYPFLCVNGAFSVSGNDAKALKPHSRRRSSSDEDFIEKTFQSKRT